MRRHGVFCLFATLLIMMVGSTTAIGGGPCPWDCADSNGEVGTADLLALLSQWGQIGTSCDFQGNAVGTTDLLELLSNWGVCP